jgi:formylglycine-generating enzyme required for sulfatase activity
MENILTYDYILANSVSVPETIFPLGANYEDLDESLKEVDRKRRLNIANLLAPTPIVWVHLNEFAIGKFMVTNREYLVFVQSGARGLEPINYDSPELWWHVWSILYKIQEVVLPYKTVSERVMEDVQNYTGCKNFVDAYIESLKYELMRVINRTEGRVPMPPLEVFERVFRFVRYKLRNVLGEEDEIFSDFSESPYSDLKMFQEDLKTLLKAANEGYKIMADRRVAAALSGDAFIVEPPLFFHRFFSACKATKTIEEPIPLHKVLYPRDWKSVQGDAKGGTPGLVPWGERPVFWITFYEALAFCIWLTLFHRLYERGTQITLPNEAEYECAATWTPEEIKNDMVLDSRKKDILPWLKRHKGEFHQYFGREGVNLFAQSWYKDVLEMTSREIGSDKIYQLVGFGWQWMLDRYDYENPRYRGLRQASYKRYTQVKAKSPDGKVLDVVDFTPFQGTHASLYVLRGSPEIIGGPGLATRRYAKYPLRGYENVGFRWVIKEV